MDIEAFNEVFGEKLVPFQKSLLGYETYLVWELFFPFADSELAWAND